MPFIGIDLGTSFIKGAVLDLKARRILHIHREPFPAAIPGLPPLYREVEPSQVLAAVRSLLAALLPYTGGCEGIVMCSQMHGLVLTTEHGEPRSTLTTWQDQRVLMPHPSGQGTYFDVLASRLSREQIRQLGNELRPGQPIGLLFWLAERGQLPEPDLYLASLPDFVISNLCGSPPSIEASHAMSHGALNLETMGWHREVLAALGLDRLRWPEIRKHGEVVGWLKADGHTIPCYTPIGDYQAAILGSLLQYNELSLNISTGSQVSLLKPEPEFGDFQTRPFFGRFLAAITHIPAGRALTALVKLLTELAEAQGVTLADPWGYIGQAAAKVGPTRMRADLAFFTSSCGDHGAFTDVREEELTVGHLFRAAFQNMADNYYACALRIAGIGAGLPSAPLRADVHAAPGATADEKAPLTPQPWGEPRSPRSRGAGGAIFRAGSASSGSSGEPANPPVPWRNPSTPLRAGLVFSGGLAQKFPVLRELILEKFGVGYRMCPTAEDTLLGLMALALAFTGRTASVEQAAAELLENYRE